MPLLRLSPTLLIFDWDGTLVDSIGRIVHCFEKTYTLLDLIPPAEAKIRKTIGLPLKEGFLQLGVGLDAPGIESLAKTYRSVWLDPQLAHAPLFPGTRDLLIRLKKAGYLLAVATGKSRVGLDRESKNHSVDHLFDATVCGDECQSKPSPDMVIRLLEATSTSAAEALVLGDSPLDLAMAKNACIPSIGVLSGAGDLSSLNIHNPITCIEHVGYLDLLVRM